MYREIKPTPHVQGENRTPPNSDSVFQIAEALAKVTQLQWLPQAKPDVFTGNETDTKFFVWETAFDALIDSAPISAQKKLYLLYQHLDGKAKKVVEQLQGNFRLRNLGRFVRYSVPCIDLGQGNANLFLQICNR